MSETAAPDDLPVRATYLEVHEESFRPALLDDPAVSVRNEQDPTVPFYRHLYATVGAGFSWVDRLRWTDDRLAAHLARGDVTILVLSVDGEVAGYAELVGRSSEPGTELAYFGIFPQFHGKGLGKHLLSVAVRRALDDGAVRVWLSTRSTDGPHAIANYRARGFSPYRTEWEPAPVHPSEE